MNQWAMLMKMKNEDLIQIKSRENFYVVKSGMEASGWELRISLRLVAMYFTSD